MSPFFWWIFEKFCWPSSENVQFLKWETFSGFILETRTRNTDSLLLIWKHSKPNPERMFAFKKSIMLGQCITERVMLLIKPTGIPLFKGPYFGVI